MRSRAASPADCILRRPLRVRVRMPSGLTSSDANNTQVRVRRGGSGCLRGYELMTERVWGRVLEFPRREKRDRARLAAFLHELTPAYRLNFTVHLRLLFQSLFRRCHLRRARNKRGLSDSFSSPDSETRNRFFSPKVILCSSSNFQHWAFRRLNLEFLREKVRLIFKQELLAYVIENLSSR